MLRNKFKLCLLIVSTYFATANYSQAIDPPAMAATSKTATLNSSPYLQIPVLYMTDRAKSPLGYANQRKYEKRSIYNVYFGSLKYTLPNTKLKPITESRKQLGWQAVSKSKKPLVTVHSLDGSGTDEAYHKFGQALVEAAQKTDSKEIFIFLHGFNNPFAGAAGKAAALSYAVERPVVLYSWPSAGRLTQYAIDACNSEWSQEHYNRLLEELVHIKEKYGLKFDLVAHSMGNRLVIRSAEIIHGKHLFEQVFLVDPDMDAETFVHYIARYALSCSKKGSTQLEILGNAELNDHGKLRILFSHKDNCLPISQLFFGGYTRLGQGADSMLASLFDVDGISNILQGAANILQNNPQPTEEDSAKKDLDNNDEHNDTKQMLKKAFEWIDYTVLDHGMLGHTVPFDLLASLWASGQAGEGLELVAGKNDKVNRFTRFVSRMFGETGRIDAIDTFEQVVYTNSAKTKKKISSALENSNQ